MRATQLLTVAVVSALLLGGTAALGAAAPAGQAAESVTDAPEANASEGPQNETVDAERSHADGSKERAEDARNRSNDADSVGPSDALPEQAPDQVSEIHRIIESFLNGSTDGLDKSLGERLSGGGAAGGHSSADSEIDDSDNRAG